MTSWLILTATLPTSPSGLRVKVWRALRATGAGALREGVYVLPEHAPSASALSALERTIVDAGAVAHLLVVQARDDAQEQAFRSLFDRAELYAEFLQTAKEARTRLRSATEATLRKTLRGLQTQLHAIQAIDFFPGRASDKAVDAMVALRREIELHLAPDEPSATAAAIARCEVADFQGRTWATRQRPWVDRLATAWLIQRFIDKSPTFIWLADARKCPKSALGYDFDGATFTHVGERVTFEVVAETFGLLGDPALQRLAALVHCIDIGGMPVEEAPGLEMLIRGLQARHADDHALLAAALSVFDACYAALETPSDP
ncbi:chromate resistance protein [Ideonella sp. 4Y16]|uniref:chromate resistance protein ChrB domain-containing protein n=1 Tax=Ideonella alba TaxID=2824118 RepID=UPI001B37529B|nr:chromate resistance protein ChrB domain-containing protein [Ideonella alba]MBQ0941775.1 chromate resistance protein [Ideonella alba]